MKIIESILTKNDCYTSGRTITVKGLMLHSVGTPQPDATVFTRNWNRSGLEVCVHAFIDGNTGNVYQTLPWNRRGWHCGDDANNTHIGVEMCEPDTIRYTSGSSWVETGDGKNTAAVVKRTYDSAVQLFAKLCKDYNLDPLKDGVIISHSEGAKRGIASAHADVEHIWNKLGYSMDGFRKDVAKAMGQTVTEEKQMYRVRKTWADAKSQIGAYSVLENAKNACPSGYKVFDNDGNVVYTPDTGKDKDEVKVAMIGNGDSGNTVKAAQAILEAFGYSCGSAGADGIFGSGTESAVKKFQKAKGLSADGIIGPDTWNALLN